MRHAYLIAAHGNFQLLETLLELLDDPRNDIFLHMDAKTRNFDANRMSAVCRRSATVVLPRRAVYWGDYSQVASVLAMIRVALAHDDYSYFHVLSGQDLPIKSADYIHDFFREHQGREFVAFNEPPQWTHEWLAHYYPLNRLVRSPIRCVRWTLARGRKMSVALQRQMGVDRTRNFGELDIRYGSDWFSITSALAAHLVASEPTIERLFRWSFNPVEYYVQTMVWNSEFRDRVHDYSDPYRSNMRLIDFERGVGSSPHTWQADDFAQLASSDRLFARKFDPDVDPHVIELVRHHVTAE